MPAPRDPRHRPRLLPHHEFWPTWLFYAPLVPWWLCLAARHRHPMAWTACNPGIECGGGVVGESKHTITRALITAAAAAAQPHVSAPAPNTLPLILPTTLIPRHQRPADRAAAALDSIAREPLLRFPLILKPDAGYRGHAVRLAHAEPDIHDYFARVHAPVLLQPYHPGPHEVGIAWVRTRAHAAPESHAAGRIFSITRKEFPFITGDGDRTLESLIRAHPRYRSQAHIFLARLGPRAGDTPGPGERVRLAISGNHCQGTLFRDGADLITPALSATIGALAANFPGGLDAVRFDVRYTDDDSLRAARPGAFSIVEMNGTLGESTNIYDPDRSYPWAITTLARQWRELFRLGAARIREGRRPLGIRETLRLRREFLNQRSGPTVAD